MSLSDDLKLLLKYRAPDEQPIVNIVATAQLGTKFWAIDEDEVVEYIGIDPGTGYVIVRAEDGTERNLHVSLLSDVVPLD